MPKDSQELKEKLRHIIHEAVKQDNDLRTQLNIGEKFRFIRDRLQLLKQHVEEVLKTIEVEDSGQKHLLEHDEQIVYIYLFNAHGIDTQSWAKMLHPSVYYEHSVNRPIYGEKEHVEMVIRSKVNRIQHGYLEVAIKKNAILRKNDANIKDNLGNPLLKIKEGSLRPERLIHFAHNGNYYQLDEQGKLEKLLI